MGIPGLLQGLRFATRHANIHEFQGQSVCVDGSSWLHKAVYSVAEHYVEAVERGALDERTVATASSYIRSRCEELLRYAEVRRVYFVLDGKRCPLKAGTNAERDRRREENLREARRLAEGGDREGAFEKYKNCIKVTTELSRAVAKNLARAFKNGKVQVVWAPYEADPQLVKLCLDGHCNAIITEDSDVLVYCAAVRSSFPVLFKFDRKSGSCQVITMAWLLCPETNLCRTSTAKDSSKKKTSGIETHLEVFAAREFRTPGFGARLFVQACILAGCDYAINELEGVGLVNAFKAIRGAIHRKDDDRFRQALLLLPPKACEGINKLDYEELLAKSEAVFYQHPVVEASGKVVHLIDAEANHPHFPSLERFATDRSFIGQVAPDGLEPSQPLHDKTNTLPPVPEVTITHKGTRLKSRNDDENEYDEGLKRATVVVPVLNPYVKSKKRGHEDIGSEQTQPIKKNPFAAFMAKKPGKENDENLTRKAKPRSYRFVRPPEKLNLNLTSFWFSKTSTVEDSKPAHSGESHSNLQRSISIEENFRHNQPEVLDRSKCVAENGMRVSKHCQDYQKFGTGSLAHEQRSTQVNNDPPAHFHYYSKPNDPATASSDREGSDNSARYYSDVNPSHPQQASLPSQPILHCPSVDSYSSRQSRRPTSRQVNSMHPLSGASVYCRTGNYANQHPDSCNTESNFLSNWNDADVSHNVEASPSNISAGAINVDKEPALDDTESLFAEKFPSQSAFEYDDWLASPQNTGQLMTNEELQADDIVHSPEVMDHRYPLGLIQRNVPMQATKAIGPIKKFRNRFSRPRNMGTSAPTRVCDETRLSSRAQAKLSMFFGHCK